MTIIAIKGATRFAYWGIEPRQQVSHPDARRGLGCDNCLGWLRGKHASVGGSVWSKRRIECRHNYAGGCGGAFRKQFEFELRQRLSRFRDVYSAEPYE
jgi:hypothetical protein